MPKKGVDIRNGCIGDPSNNFMIIFILVIKARLKIGNNFRFSFNMHLDIINNIKLRIARVKKSVIRTSQLNSNCNYIIELAMVNM